MDLFDFDKTEKQLSKVKYILGTDEAGRGPAAGGVFAACVCFFKNTDEELFKTLNDSKKLTAKKREYLFDIIKANSFYSIHSVEVETIEKINILNASLTAMKYAVEDVIKQIKSSDYIALIDGNKLIKDTSLNQKYIIKGDSKSASIAAASILAKVSRDNYMDSLAKIYPNYEWHKNKGYLTKAHIDAIQRYGTNKYHRLSFLKNILGANQMHLILK